MEGERVIPLRSCHLGSLGDNQVLRGKGAREHLLPSVARAGAGESEGREDGTEGREYAERGEVVRCVPLLGSTGEERVLPLTDNDIWHTLCFCDVRKTLTTYNYAF